MIIICRVGLSFSIHNCTIQTLFWALSQKMAIYISIYDDSSMRYNSWLHFYVAYVNRIWAFCVLFWCCSSSDVATIIYRMIREINNPNSRCRSRRLDNNKYSIVWAGLHSTKKNWILYYIQNFYSKNKVTEEIYLNFNIFG